MYQSYYHHNDNKDRTFEGLSGSSYNSVLRRTRQLFSGQGYRVNNTESHAPRIKDDGTYSGSITIQNATDTVTIRVELLTAENS